VRSIYERHSPKDEILLPDFCPEHGLDDLEKRITDALARGVRRFRVASLAGLELLRRKGDNVEVTAFFPLPVCNSLAAAELLDMGVDRFCAWIELAKEDIDELRPLLGDRMELYVYGRPPLLTTRAALPAEGDVTDPRGGRFRIVREGNLTRLYPAQVFSITAPEGVSTYFDLTQARPGERDTSTFNYEREFV
jgi:hypothetical protein